MIYEYIVCNDLNGNSRILIQIAFKYFHATSDKDTRKPNSTF